MSIWDDITKRMSDAASFTKKKTGELTGIAKVKYSIHSEESKLSECYEEIGKLYYAYQRENIDYVAEIAALIAEADVIKITISELKAELAKLQNATICPSCGAKLDNAMIFCPTCGTKQEKEEPACDCGCDCDCENEKSAEDDNSTEE